MAPIRRYLRITQHSVLECRIYLENPALADSWLLRTRDPTLPRVLESVRPLVLPKLREENERSKGKGKKNAKGIKDVIVRDDFEVALFLTEPSTRHSLLRKQKHYRDPQRRIKTSNRHLTSLASEVPTQQTSTQDAPIVIREEEDEDGLTMQDIPLASEAVGGDGPGSVSELMGEHALSRQADDHVSSNDQDLSTRGGQAQRRRQGRLEGQSEEPPLELSDDTDDQADYPEDKKKLVAHCSYDGYSIYGRILCLVVKRRPTAKERPSMSRGPAMMEDWIASTQLE